MSAEESKTEARTIQCPMSGTVVVQHGVGTVIRPPCPQTSIPSMITQKPHCPDWHESKKECKWILARDSQLEAKNMICPHCGQSMNSGIVKP